MHQEDQNSGNDPQANSNGGDQDILKGLNLSEEELNTLKANSNILNVVEHLVSQKRLANDEAKKYRTNLEKLESDRKAKEDENLAKQGEYQKLYEDSQKKNQAMEEKTKQALINGELRRLAGVNGLAKLDYIKLLDVSDIEVDIDSLSINGLEDKFKQFKTENPNLFTTINNNVPSTDNSQQNNGSTKNDKLNNYNKLIEKIKTDPNNKALLAQKFTLHKALKKEGLIK